LQIAYIWLLTMAIQVATLPSCCLSLHHAVRPCFPVRRIAASSSASPFLTRQVLFGYGVKFYSNDSATVGGKGPENWFPTLVNDWVSKL